MLLVFGAIAGAAWAIMALFVYNVAGDGIPAVLAYTLLLPLAATFIAGSWIHMPVDVIPLLVGIGAALGVLIAAACTLYFRVRGI
jgi:hypothetical protein